MIVSALELKNVTKIYQNGLHNQTVLNNVSVGIMPGKLTAFSGPSGSGKSTLLSILGTIEEPTSGAVYFNGENLNALNPTQLAQVRNQHFGFIFQAAHFVPYKSLLENVMLPAHYHQKFDHDKSRKRALELLELVGLHEHQDKSPSILSGGEQQRMSFARAMLLEPDVIFADEPTANLDANNSKKLLELLKGQTLENRTVVLVSHDSEALGYAHKVHLMNKEKGLVNDQ
jgi:putative ABC transport system ATP-binding protein